MGEDERDDLEELIAQRAAKNPAFPAMVEVARQQHALEREGIARRERLGYSAEGIADPARNTAGRLLPRAKHSKRRLGERFAQGKS
jgi:hypothetical protein